MTREEIYQALYSTEEVYPPPLEQHSALLEVTTGCSYRKCKFCDFPRDAFRIFSLKAIAEKIELLRLVIDGKTRLHLLGCNPFCLHTKQLLAIADMIHNRLPTVQEISMYARADDVLKKSDEELALLAVNGITDLHIGLESGSSAVLRLHEKGVTPRDVEDAMDRLDRFGIRCHLTVIPGLGGKEFSQEHAVKTAELLSRHRPVSIWCIALKIWPGTPLEQMIREGQFAPLSPGEIVREEREMIRLMNLTMPCLYVDSTVLNKYTVIALMPEQKESVLQQMDALLQAEGEDL